MKRKHNVDEVIKSLTKKGCIITNEQPITGRVDKVLEPDKEAITKAYREWLQKQNNGIMVAIKSAVTQQYPLEFVGSHKKLFAPETIKVTVVTQPPFTVNIKAAKELGNGSWGKIDFLTNHCGYTVMR